MKLTTPAYYERQRLAAYQRDDGRCVVCRKPGEQTHHRQGRGGDDPHRLSNLLTICDQDHRRIHAAPAWAYQHGYMVKRHGITTTEETPVMVGGRLMILTNHIKETA